MFKVGDNVVCKLSDPAYAGVKGIVNGLTPGTSDVVVHLYITDGGTSWKPNQVIYMYARDLAYAVPKPKESCEPVKYKTSRVSLLVHRDSA